MLGFRSECRFVQKTSSAKRNPDVSETNLLFLARNCTQPCWCQQRSNLSQGRSRNRRASDYLQGAQRGRQARADSSSSACVTVFLISIVYARTGDPGSQHSGTAPSPPRDSIKRIASVRGSHIFFTMFTRGRIGKRCVSTNLFTRAWW